MVGHAIKHEKATPVRAGPLIGGLKADIAIRDNASAIRNFYRKHLIKQGNMTPGESQVRFPGSPAALRTAPLVNVTKT
jgi:hypothetical protein